MKQTRLLLLFALSTSLFGCDDSSTEASAPEGSVGDKADDVQTDSLCGPTLENWLVDCVAQLEQSGYPSDLGFSKCVFESSGEMIAADVCQGDDAPTQCCG